MDRPAKMWLAFALGRMADAATTLVGLAAGGEELVPFTRWLLSLSPLLFVTYQFAVSLLLLPVFHLLGRDWGHPLPNRTAAVCMAALAAVSWAPPALNAASLLALLLRA
jgi:hypothetical protein